jgi:hypothetical protein
VCDSCHGKMCSDDENVFLLILAAPIVSHSLLLQKQFLSSIFKRVNGKHSHINTSVFRLVHDWDLFKLCTRLSQIIS